MEECQVCPWRTVTSTNMNSESSRSHLIFSLIIECTDLQTQVVTRGKLSFVDLAVRKRGGLTLPPLMTPVRSTFSAQLNPSPLSCSQAKSSLCVPVTTTQVIPLLRYSQVEQPSRY